MKLTRKSVLQADSAILFNPRKRKNSNCSFKDIIAPHCTVHTRYCYCQMDEGIRKCEVGRNGNGNDNGNANSSVLVHDTYENIAVYRERQRKGIFCGSELTFEELLELETKSKQNGNSVNHV